MYRFIAVAFLAALLLASGGSAPAQDLTPYVLNVVAGVTGPNAFGGDAQAKAALAAADLINRQGGINGRPMKVVVSDDQANPQIAVQLYTRFAEEKVPVVIGPGLTSTCGAVFPIITAAGGPLMWCNSPGMAPSPGSLAFSAVPSADDQVIVQTRYFRLRGWTRVAAITSNDAGGQSFDHGLKIALALPENKSMQLVALEHINPGDISAAAAAARIKAANPQAIYTLSTGPAWLTMMQGLYDAGVMVPNAPGPGNRPLLTQPLKFLPPSLYFPAFIPEESSATGPGPQKVAQTAFFNALKTAGIVYNPASTPEWDPIMMTVAALRKFGTSMTADQLRNYVLNLHGWVGIMGMYDFSKFPQRGVGTDALIMDRWDSATREWTLVSRPGGYLR